MTFNELLKLDQETGTRPAKSRKKPVPPAPGQPGTKKATKVTAMKDTTKPDNRDTMQPRNHATTQPCNHATVQPRNRAVNTPSVIRRLRKAVKVFGKEIATYRFTPEEKDSLAEIVYTYGRQGHRTSENEVVRIGVNWLLNDYQENGRQSVLHKVLKALRA